MLHSQGTVRIFYPSNCKLETNGVKELLKKHKTSLVKVPPECTSRVQVVDVLIDKPFKDEVRSLFEDHVDKNLDQYVDVR